MNPGAASFAGGCAGTFIDCSKFADWSCLQRCVSSGLQWTRHFRNFRLCYVSDGPIFSLAREKMGEKRVLGNVWCIPHLILGDNRICQNSFRPNTPYRSLTTRRPSFRYQVWQQLRLHYCGKSVLQLKFVMQYGSALDCRPARERSKKTEAVSAMQTQPAVCIARGGTKRQNKKPCSTRLRFVSFDSDEV